MDGKDRRIHTFKTSLKCEGYPPTRFSVILIKFLYLAPFPKVAMYYIIRSILIIPLVGITLFAFTMIIVLLSILTLGQAQNWIIANGGHLLGKTILLLAGVHVNMYDNIKEHHPPAIYMINHSSTLDLFLILYMGLSKVRFVAKYELQYNPFFLIMGRITGQIFIDRNKSQKAISRMQKAYNKIKRRGLSVLVAPEGTRKHKGIIGPFKKGGFHMAMDLGYPIIPIYFEGARNLAPGSTILVKSGTVNIHIHNPIDTSNWTKETLNHHIEELRQTYIAWSKQK